jgi:hypothetical protein
MIDESGTPTIYDDYVDIIAGASNPPNQLHGPVTAGTAITLPNGATYTGAEVEVYLSGQRIEDVIDYNYVGGGARTQISLTFDLVVGDRIRFRIDRGA